ncbi:diguanylate cyclase [Vibrio olivae]
MREHDIWEDEVTLYQGESEITTIMRVQSSFDSKGKLSYYIVSFVDISERKVLEEKLRVLSEKDPMSDLWNRRKFEQELRRSALLAQLADSNKPTCLALIDIDHFKRINDELGHDEGDRIISRVSYVMSSVVRHSDFLARIGGEEFAVIMPNTSIADANMALNRIREQVEIDTQASVTVSVGFTQLTPDYTRSYKCADIALYESKTIGRNQVSLCLDCEDIA